MSNFQKMAFAFFLLAILFSGVQYFKPELLPFFQKDGTYTLSGLFASLGIYCGAKKT